MRFPNKIFVRCKGCGRVYHIDRVPEERPAKCRPCGHEFVIPPAEPISAPKSWDHSAAGRAEAAQFEAAHIATVMLTRSRKPLYRRKGPYAVACGVLLLVFLASFTHGFSKKVSPVVVSRDTGIQHTNMRRGRVAKLSEPQSDREFKSVTELIEAIEPSVVQVETGTGIGSGFVVDESGLIVTCYHCIKGAPFAHVVFSNGRRLPVRGTAKVAPQYDIAILVVEASDDLRPLRLAKTLPKKGEPIVVMGSPIGLSFSQSEGSVSGLRTAAELHKLSSGFADLYSFEPDTMIVQVTASLMPGNSGGPIVDFSGNVVGISSFLLGWRAQLYEFSISAQEIRKVAEQVDDTLTPLWIETPEKWLTHQLDELGRSHRSQ